MRKTGYVGIAKITMQGRENIVIIRARENGFALHTMFYENEIWMVSDGAIPKGEVTLASLPTQAKRLRSPEGSVSSSTRPNLDKDHLRYAPGFEKKD
jgi:non-homologous end joining protein Ku